MFQKRSHFEEITGYIVSFRSHMCTIFQNQCPEAHRVNPFCHSLNNHIVFHRWLVLHTARCLLEPICSGLVKLGVMGQRWHFYIFWFFLLLIVPDMFWKSTKHNKIEIRSIGGIFLFLSAFHTRLAHLSGKYFLYLPEWHRCTICL